MDGPRGGWSGTVGKCPAGVLALLYQEFQVERLRLRRGVNTQLPENFLILSYLSGLCVLCGEI